MDILAAERDVIAVDLPGFGASPALPDGLSYDLTTTTAVFGAFCEALELDRPHVAGNSLGGLLALELGREKLVRSVTALSPPGSGPRPSGATPSAMLLTMRHGSRRMPLPLIERLSRSAAGRAALTSTIYARPGRRSPEAVVAETLALRGATGFHQTLGAGRDILFTDDIPGLPVTVAWGTRDRLLVRRQGIRAKQVIPGARLVRLPGCGHCPHERRPRAGRARHPRRQPLTGGGLEHPRAQGDSGADQRTAHGLGGTVRARADEGRGAGGGDRDETGEERGALGADALHAHVPARRSRRR